MPQHGIHSVTVPGAVDGWDVLLQRLGSRSLQELLAPAARLAEEGFAITERIRNDWIHGQTLLQDDADSVKVYLPGGHLPEPYGVFRNPELAHALHVLQAKGRTAFYEGEIAQALVAKSQALGGSLTLEDLRNTHATWEHPISTAYHGYDVYEFPPNTQGFAVLEMLNILEVCTPGFGLDLRALGPRSPSYWHLLVEAKKLAYADLYAFNADPGFVSVPVERLISKDYARTLCAKIDPHKAAAVVANGDPVGGTVYLTTADRFGNMVSFIYSVYDTFGSGVTVPGYGFVLNDRGGLFSLDAKSPNVIAPGKRPFHTLLPGFLMKDGRPVMAFGLMGGSQQAQGHAQVLIDMIDLGANPQAASDAARFSHAQANNTLYLESQLFQLVGARLRAMGHTVTSSNGDDMGGYQAIWLNGAIGNRDGIRPDPRRVSRRIGSPQGRRRARLVTAHRVVQGSRPGGQGTLLPWVPAAGTGSRPPALGLRRDRRVDARVAFLGRELRRPLPRLGGGLARPLQRQLAVRRRLRDGRTGAGRGARADAHRRDQHGVRADERVVADERRPFVEPVVVAGDGARADVDAARRCRRRRGRRGGWLWSPRRCRSFFISTKLPMCDSVGEHRAAGAAGQRGRARQCSATCARSMSGMREHLAARADRSVTDHAVRADAARRRRGSRGRSNTHVDVDEDVLADDSSPRTSMRAGSATVAPARISASARRRR